MTIISSVQGNDWKDVYSRLEKSEDPDGQDNDGNTPLFVASREGYADIVLLLLLYWAKPNGKSGNNRNLPLNVAALKGHAVVVKLLLDFGANPNARGTGNTTALQEAKGPQKSLIEKMLRAAGAEE